MGQLGDPWVRCLLCRLCGVLDGACDAVSRICIPLMSSESHVCPFNLFSLVIELATQYSVQGEREMGFLGNFLYSGELGPHSRAHFPRGVNHKPIGFHLTLSCATFEEQVTQVKSNCSFTISIASKLIFFFLFSSLAAVLCWNFFTGNLDFHKGSPIPG